jgi:hypothetical protein
MQVQALLSYRRRGQHVRPERRIESHAERVGPRRFLTAARRIGIVAGQRQSNMGAEAALAPPLTTLRAPKLDGTGLDPQHALQLFKRRSPPLPKFGCPDPNPNSDHFVERRFEVSAHDGLEERKVRRHESTASAEWPATTFSRALARDAERFREVLVAQICPQVPMCDLAKLAVRRVPLACTSKGVPVEPQQRPRKHHARPGLHEACDLVDSPRIHGHERSVPMESVLESPQHLGQWRAALSAAEAACL